MRFIHSNHAKRRAFFIGAESLFVQYRQPSQSAAHFFGIFLQNIPLWRRKACRRWVFVENKKRALTKARQNAQQDYYTIRPCIRQQSCAGNSVFLRFARKIGNFFRQDSILRFPRSHDIIQVQRGDTNDLVHPPDVSPLLFRSHTFLRNHIPGIETEAIQEIQESVPI